MLGAIALAPTSVGGHYSLSARFTSLEPGNTFQDQDFVFGYVDEDNFFILETIRSGLNIFSVVGGDRMLVGQVATQIAYTFSHDPTTVVLEHNAETGDVTITYGTEGPATFNNPALVREGVNRVGVGSNNDAFTVDDFVITQLGPATAGTEIVDFERDPVSGMVTVTWTSVAGTLYTVSRSLNLVIWDDLEDSAIGESGTTSYEDTPNGESAFYRVQKNSP